MTFLALLLSLMSWNLDLGMVPVKSDVTEPPAVEEPAEEISGGPLING